MVTKVKFSRKCKSEEQINPAINKHASMYKINTEFGIF